MTISAEVQQIIRHALSEDIGSGDVTSLATIPADTYLEGQFLVKAAGVIAGLEIAGQVFVEVDPTIVFAPLVDEGSRVDVGDVVARVTGRGPGILTAERVALNFLQRMSGIATATRRYVKAVEGTRAKILDTRKTVPGLRPLDKLAVRLGGGANHRIGLYDMVLIKDNHIQAAGGITEAVRRVRAQTSELPIEVEVESLEQLDEALASQVDRIMLDNMSLVMMRTAVERAGGRVELEASGGITLDDVAQVAETGVDLISVGALTHSVHALDISLDLTMNLADSYVKGSP
jgi:nicotinate-nucleotide pyrophosphorylase (carboxylating)